MIRLDDNADTFPVGLQGTPFETVYRALRTVSASVWSVDPTVYRAGMAWGWYALHKPEALVGFRDMVTAALISAIAPLVKDTQTDEELVEYLRLWRSYTPTFPKLQALYALFGLTVDIQPISDLESQAILPVDDTRLAFYVRIESVDFSRPMPLGEVHDLAVRATPLGSRPYPYYALETHIDVPTAAISEECGITVGDSGIAQLPPMELILVDDATGRVVNGGMFGDALELADVHVSHLLVQPVCGAITQGVQLGTLQLDPQVGVELVEEEPVVMLPTVTEIWTLPNNSSGISTIQSGSANTLWINTPSWARIPYDVTSCYAVAFWRKANNTLGGRTEFSTENISDLLSARNVSSNAIEVYWIKVAVCSSSQATVVTVYNSSNVAYNAFKYTVSGSDYYYVLDGAQTDWTDDLNSIGYRLYIDIILGLKWDGSTWKAVDVSNDFWWAGILSTEDQSRLALIGLVAEYSMSYPFSVLCYDSASYSYEFIELYSDMGETIIPTTASDFIVDNLYSPSPYVASIRCTGSYGTLAKTWKCRITKL